MKKNYEILDMVTTNSEKYKCTFPASLTEEEERREEENVTLYFVKSSSFESKNGYYISR